MSGGRALRVVVVEDEPLARATLRRFLDQAPRLSWIGEAADGRSAVRLIDRLTPDLVFLDVEMPELSGLEVLARIEHRPAVVFTTAYDHYAVAAFELEAIDYLLKPFDRTRFLDAVARIERRLAGPEPSPLPPPAARLAQALDEQPLRRLFVRKREQIVAIDVDDIVRVEAADDYAAVHAGGRRHLLALPLAALEARLDPARFLRVHRAHLINLDQVETLHPHDGKRLAIVFRDGSRVVASRGGSRRLRTLIH